MEAVRLGCHIEERETLSIILSCFSSRAVYLTVQKFAQRQLLNMYVSKCSMPYIVAGEVVWRC